MTPQTVIDIFSSAIQLVVLLVMLIVLPSLLVGLVVSIFQAATQINEQTLSFLPRLITIFVILMLAGPWILTRLVSYSQTLLGSIPQLIG
ncbi:MAG: flagellar biosynthesis protein FliQ [Pseudomonadales bacterium]|jgi:flagellar biosynthetic protein FliQ|nr:flagellar biosynthesis protein FliQ [Pseudomonadales bacterium]MCP5333554.1 flagellar biosynthesis protein FliQ [Pseudomonadales bacterium]HMU90176.1 flagellar biosynthesis protein FliQ [Pseudomonadales bacterium]HMW15231.1 flagellar biosynthesis protein FliQ [Pseudomonadales bacterium]HMW83374.1 flagellar biosynthesis protein FliQ [Pseudomonadales bacterium]